MGYLINKIITSGCVFGENNNRVLESLHNIQFV